jgi:predicted phage tail component-like protein
MYGLTYKGISSSTFNLSLLSDNRQVLSDVVRFTKTVPGYGVVDFGNDTYSEKALVVSLTYCALTLEAMQTQMEQIGGWLYNDGAYHDLIFDDAPLRKFKAKVTSKINLKQGDLIGELSVEFTCNPPYPCALDNSPVNPADVQGRLLWDTMKLDGIQYLQDLSANDTIKFTVGGNLSVKPVIKLIGNIASGLTLTYGAYSWKYNAALLFDGIIIDCVAQTVTRMSDGANLFPNVDATYDDYFNLAIGQQSIAVVGVVGAFPNDLTIAVEFTPQYS